MDDVLKAATTYIETIFIHVEDFQYEVIDQNGKNCH